MSPCPFSASSSCCLCHSDECQGETPRSAVTSLVPLPSITCPVFPPRNSPLHTPGIKTHLTRWNLGTVSLFLFNFILCPSPLTVYLTEFIFSVVPCSKPAQMARLRNPLCSVQRSNVFPIHPFYVYHLFILLAKTVTQLRRKESVSEYGNGP